MIDISTRTLLFFGGCIPLRLALVYLTYQLGNSDHVSHQTALTAGALTAGALVAIAIGLTFVSLWTFHLRQNAPEGGGITWWNSIRPVHGALWILTGVLLYTPSLRQFAWMVLLVDVILGLGAWIKHHG